MMDGSEDLKGHPVRARPRRWARLARVAGLLGIALLAALLHSRALAAVAVILIVLLTAFLLPWLTVRWVGVRCSYPLRRGQVGKPLAVRLTLRSGLPWPAVGLVVRGGWTDAADADPVTVAVPSLPPWGQREVATTIIPSRRGAYPRYPAAVVTSFPFGLFQATGRAESSGQVLVWPEIVHFGTPARETGSAGRGLTAQARRAGSHGEFFGARPYRSGEPLRQIHWKQSARHDQLIVWESRVVTRGAVVLLVETDSAVHVHAAAGASVEKALSIAASFASGLVEEGLHVTLVFEQGAVFSAANRQELGPALDALARFEASRGASQAALQAHLPVGATRSATVWLVTTRAGWQRGGLRGRPGKVVVIDDRAADAEGSLQARVARVPVLDPDHRGLLEAWKEVTANGEILV